MAALDAARAAAASLSSPRPPEIHFSVAVASTPHVVEAIVRASVEVERINLAALNPCATWSMPSPDTRNSAPANKGSSLPRRWMSMPNDWTAAERIRIVLNIADD